MRFKTHSFLTERQTDAVEEQRDPMSKAMKSQGMRRKSAEMRRTPEIVNALHFSSNEWTHRIDGASLDTEHVRSNGALVPPSLVQSRVAPLARCMHRRPHEHWTSIVDIAP